MSDVLEQLSQGSIVELLRVLIDANYFDFLFPFLLLFALLFHVIQKILGRKSSKLFSKSAATVIATIVSFYSVIYTFPSGYTIGDLMMMLFPNISSISIAILSLYVVGSVMGRDFFKDAFRKDISAYTIMFFGVIALGSVVYYVGIVIGLWSFDPYDSASWISVIITVAFLIVGIVFLLIGWFAIGLLLLYVSGSFIYNMGEVGLSSLLFDPYLFILFVFIGIMSWLFKDEKDENQILKEKLNKSKDVMKDIEKNYGGKPPKRGEDLLYDINSQNYENMSKK
ncbi:MAG: hypothetical protein ACLFPL_05370 [Candidatus Nanoarchaeia archaeon]